MSGDRFNDFTFLQNLALGLEDEVRDTVASYCASFLKNQDFDDIHARSVAVKIYEDAESFHFISSFCEDIINEMLTRIEDKQ